LLPQNCVVLCRWKRLLCWSALLKPFRPIRSSDARPVEIGLKVTIREISFVARFSTRKHMFQVARDHDVTLKALILSALREKYPTLGIEDADLIDLRAKR
jgi:hypothetical protein